MLTATDRIEIDRALRSPRWGIRDFDSDAIGTLVYRTYLYSLTPIQLAALTAVYVAGGAFLMIGVGHGKTLIAMLAPQVLQAKRPLIMVPSGLEDSLNTEREKWLPHFRIPDFGVLKYSELQQPSSSLWFDGYQPDLIVMDEAQNAKNPQASRTWRILDYLAKNPRCRLIVMTGTITSQSPKDYAHLLEGAFGEFAPLPRIGVGSALDAWHNVISPKGKIVATDASRVKPLLAQYPHAQGETLRERSQNALFAHLVWSRGIVATVESSCPKDIYLEKLDMPLMPQNISDAITHCIRHHERPNGIPFLDENEEGAVIRQLECGFYYWTDFGAAPPDLVDRWKRARSLWMRSLAHEMRTARAPGYDSPYLITCAVEAGHADKYMTETYHAWRQIEHACVPFVRAEWVSDYLMCDAVGRWHFDKEPCILWYRYRAIGEWLRKWGATVFAEGDRPDITQKVPIHCAMSIRAHGTGRNLQLWRYNRIMNMPGDGGITEQLFGRTHRLGQTRDCFFDVYLNAPGMQRNLRTARESAEYIQRTTGQKQKLLIAKEISL